MVLQYREIQIQVLEALGRDAECGQEEYRCGMVRGGHRLALETTQLWTAINTRHAKLRMIYLDIAPLGREKAEASVFSYAQINRSYTFFVH